MYSATLFSKGQSILSFLNLTWCLSPFQLVLSNRLSQLSKWWQSPRFPLDKFPKIVKKRKLSSSLRHIQAIFKVVLSPVKNLCNPMRTSMVKLKSYFGMNIPRTWNKKMKWALWWISSKKMSKVEAEVISISWPSWLSTSTFSKRGLMKSLGKISES